MDPLVLKKLHETQIEILSEIDRICKKQDITYFLEGGTLLGAVRHKGFIPWDDDIDIAMPRGDYERFLETGKSELSESFDILSNKNKNYSHLFAKVYKRNTLLLEREGVNAYNMGLNTWGIYVDIFPFDNAKNGCFIHIRRWAVIKMIHMAFRKMGFVGKESIRSKIINGLLFFTSLRFLRKCENNLCKTKGKDENYTHLISMGSKYETKRVLWLKEKILPVSQITFEGKTFCAPRDPDYFLKIKFGSDYMQLPPSEERITHDPVRISFNAEEEYEEI